jgi:hypothetical protein
VIQHHYVPFLDMIRFQITSRAGFEKLLALPPSSLTDLQRSARFLYLQRLAFGGKVAGRNFGVTPANAGRFDGRLSPLHTELTRKPLNAGLKEARQNNNAHRVGITLSNENGNLDLEKQNIEDAVEYVSEGGGTAKLKRGRKTVYDSEKDEKTVDLEDDEPIMSERKSRWSDFVDRLFG